MSPVSVARCHISSKDVPSTAVSVHAKSGSVLLNARISVGQTKMKSLVDSILHGLCRREDFRIGS